MANKKLPADYAIDALSLEASSRHISYGNLVAGTTSEQRQEIAERYKESRHRCRAGKSQTYQVADDRQDIEKLCKKKAQEKQEEQAGV